MTDPVPEVLWSEGMFLRPQHLQLFDRRIAGQIAGTWRTHQPFSWGLSRIEIAEDQLEAFTFALNRCSAVLKDGTRLEAEVNLEVEPRQFKQALDAADGELTVHLGVPRLRDGHQNTRRPEEERSSEERRFTVGSLERADENLGGARQQIEIRTLNGRLFFGDEERTGYETLPIAALRRSGHGTSIPVLSRHMVPPLLDLRAWPPLAQAVEGIAKRVEAKQRFLHAEVQEGRINLDAAGGATWQAAFKLQITGAFLHVLRQLVALPAIHPYAVYLELARLAGELSIFEEGGATAIDVPLYDHDNLGGCFRTLIFTVEQLLEKILSGQFIRVTFELREDLLIADLKPEWLAPGSELYLCVESDLGERALNMRLETAKIGAPEDIPVLKQRRLFGLDIELMRRAPGGLPARENLHYYSVARENPFWEGVTRRNAIAISGGIDSKLGFSLFVIQRPSGGD